MYYRKFIEFLKKHGIYDEEVIRYYREHWELFEYLDVEERINMGTNYIIRNGYLEEIKAIVPIMNNDITVLINVHEYIHVLMNYKKINQPVKIKTKDHEVLPIFYEKLYVKENSTEELIDYHNFLKECIDDTPEEQYVFALNISDKLMENYDNQSINELDRKVKRLVLKDTFNKFINGY